MSFPTIVYKSPGPHAGLPGKTYAYRGVADEAEMSAALADGWFRTLPEAFDPPMPAKAPEVDSGGFEDEAPPTRAELEQKARELGLSFDGRTSDKKLSERIAAALAEG